jgi:hypothetical protein
MGEGSASRREERTKELRASMVVVVRCSFVDDVEVERSKLPRCCSSPRKGRQMKGRRKEERGY